MGIYKKLAIVQNELKAPKNQYNKFGKYNFRSCEDIIEAVKPLCIKNGLVLTISDEIEFIGDRHYIKATSTIIDIESEDTFSVSASAREAESQTGMAAAQITGSTSSYARKYSLNGLFGIDDTKDDDTKDQPNKKDSSPDNKITIEQLRGVMEKKGITEAQIFATYKKETNKTITDIKFLPQDYKLKYYKMCK